MLIINTYFFNFQIYTGTILLSYSNKHRNLLNQDIKLVFKKKQNIITQSLQGTPVPGIRENNKPNHTGNEKIINHNKNYNTGQVLTCAWFRFTKCAVFLTNNIFTCFVSQKLYGPSTIRYQKTHIYIEYRQCRVLVGCFPVDYKSDSCEQIQYYAEYNTVGYQLVYLIVFIFRIQ